MSLWILLLTQCAFASGHPGGADGMSWDQIRSHPGFVVAAPTIRLGHSAGKIDVSLLSVCLDGDTLRLPSKQIEVCARFNNAFRGQDCLQKSLVSPSAPAVVTSRVCERGAIGCSLPQLQSIDYSQPISLIVSPRTRPFRSAVGKAFAKVYEVPACEMDTRRN
jgi:hypothetical protein